MTEGTGMLQIETLEHTHVFDMRKWLQMTGYEPGLSIRKRLSGCVGSDRKPVKSEI